MVRSISLAVCCAVVAVLVVPSEAFPSPSYYARDEDRYEPEEIMHMLMRLGNLIQVERRMETDKRALDLGLNRGYSGALQAKHLMGLAAAADADGPGRRRRNAH